MIPPVYAALKDDAVVRAVFGDDIRVYSFGSAPDDVQKPYALWQLVAGSPENYLDGVPDVDSFIVQIDVYCSSSSSAPAREGAKAIRDALELVAYVVSWRGESRDAETKDYRYSFDVDFLTPR